MNISQCMRTCTYLLTRVETRFCITREKRILFSRSLEISSETSSKQIASTGSRNTRQGLDAIFRPKQVAFILGDVANDKKLQATWLNLYNSSRSMRVEPVSVVSDGRFENLFGSRLNNLEALKGPLDLAVIATSILELPKVMKYLITQQVEACILTCLIDTKNLSIKETQSLFREQHELAKQHKIRILGADSLGVLNCVQGLNISSSLPEQHLPGNVALLSQSGSLICSLLDWSAKERFGFSAIAAVGSMLDVDWADLIHYFGNDKETHSIIIYMENIGNVRRFLSAAREVAVNKPIILVKPYHFHTSSLKSSLNRPSAALGKNIPKELKGPLDVPAFNENAVLDEVFRRSGVLRVHSVTDLFLSARVLAHQPRPLGSKLTIITNAGGPGSLAADQLVSGGGHLSRLSSDVSKVVQSFLPNNFIVSNPIDLSGNASAEHYKRTLEACLDNEETDGALVILTPQTMTEGTKTARILAELSTQWHERHKPLLTSFMGGKELAEAQEILRRARIPNFAFSDTAASIWNYLWRYNDYVQSLYQVPDSGFSEVAYWKESQRTAESLLRSVQREGRTLMTEIESKKLLKIYQIPVVDTRIAKEEDEAVETAKDLGFPVVLKLHSETIVHKSEVGGVKLNLTSAEAVKHAFRSIRESCGRFRGRQHFQGVVIYRMIDKPRDAHEAMLGSFIDAQAGPVIQFGTGGSLVHVYEDFAIALPPLNNILARQMMSHTKVYRALIAARKTIGADTQKIEELVERFSRMATEQAALVKACEVNPIIVGPKTISVVDARIWLHEPTKNTPHMIPTPAIRPYPSEYVFSWPGDSMGTPPFLVRPIRAEDVHSFRDFLQKPINWNNIHSNGRDIDASITVMFPPGHHPVDMVSSLCSEKDKDVQNLRWLEGRASQFCHADYSNTMTLIAETMEPDSGEKTCYGFASLNLRKGTDDEGVVKFFVTKSNSLTSELLRRLILIAKQENLNFITFRFYEHHSMLKSLCERLSFEIILEDERLRIFRATKVKRGGLWKFLRIAIANFASVPWNLDSLAVCRHMVSGTTRMLSAYEYAAAGAIAGAVEVTIQQPEIAWKNAIQDKRPIIFHPKFFYRGLTINIASMAPYTAVQFALNGVFSKWLSKGGERPLSDWEKLGVSAAAGGFSALISGPAELILIRQQRQGSELMPTLKEILARRELLRGFSLAFFRDSIYVCGYLGLTPVWTNQLITGFPSVFEDKPLAASMVASVGAGLIAAVGTQPFDTVKTRYQAMMPSLDNKKHYSYSWWSVCQQMMKESSGWRVLYDGMIPRGMRIVFGVFILSQCREIMESWFENRKMNKTVTVS
eukprot:jgi/Galph1/4270/GphlegSOOS_G2889.1